MANRLAGQPVGWPLLVGRLAGSWLAGPPSSQTSPLASRAACWPASQPSGQPASQLASWRSSQSFQRRLSDGLAGGSASRLRPSWLSWLDQLASYPEGQLARWSIGAPPSIVSAETPGTILGTLNSLGDKFGTVPGTFGVLSTDFPRAFQVTHV